MIPSEALSKLRAILNETSQGFWSDTILYYYLDSGLNKVLEILVAKNRALPQGTIHPSLLPVVKKTDINATTSNTINLETIREEIIDIITVTMYNSSTDPPKRLPLIRLDIPEFRKRINNIWLSHHYNSTAKYGQVFYIYYGTSIETSFGSNQFPSTDYPKVEILYIHRPTKITSSSTTFTLKSEVHELIIIYALYYAYLQDGRPDLAQAQLTNAEKIIALL